MVDSIEIVGFIAGMLTTGAFLPQIVQVYRTRSANDFSYGWLFLTITGLTLWLFYGLFINSIPIALFNLLTVLFLLIILYYKIYGIKISIPKQI